MNKDKKEAAQKAADQLNKMFGAGSVQWLSDDKGIEIERISTGILSLDKALGGGIPRGRVTLIKGPESSGKTSVSMQTIVEAQKLGGLCAFIDAEHAFDRDLFEKIGGDTKELILAQPDSAEQCWSICESLLDSGVLDVIVLDSIAAMVPQKEIDGDYGDSNMGVSARLNGQAMRKLVGKISKRKTALILINQLREKIGVMFGSPETMPGGKALKFYASIILDARKRGLIKDGENVVGHNLHMKVEKNKTFPPYREADTEIIYETGINFTGEVFRYAVELGLIKQGGAWFTLEVPGMEPEKIQGAVKMEQFLIDNPEIMDYIKKQ